MKKALLFEPFSGAAGDMIIGSLLDIGVPAEKIRDAVSALGLQFDVRSVVRCGIKAKHVQFHGDERILSYGDMLRMIEGSGLSDEIVRDAIAVFERIAEAEASVHGVRKEEVHFHELGGLDTIGDIVGCSIAFSEINADVVMSTCPSVGGGLVRIEHGKMPVPAPATLEILRSAGIPFRGGPIDAELLTPTGAAILAHFVHHFVNFMPEMRISRTGYGAGSSDFAEMPNVLRASIGEIADTGCGVLSRECVDLLETNVDDVSGEILGNLINVLMAEGAKDVSIVPAIMKKGRAGHIIRAVVAPEDSERIAHRMMMETGTLGVRVMCVKNRFVAQREIKLIKVPFVTTAIYGDAMKKMEKEIRVKIARDSSGNLIDISAEFEDARRIADEMQIPVREVIRMAENAAMREIM